MTFNIPVSCPNTVKRSFYMSVIMDSFQCSVPTVVKASRWDTDVISFRSVQKKLRLIALVPKNALNAKSCKAEGNVIVIDLAKHREEHQGVAQRLRSGVKRALKKVKNDFPALSSYSSSSSFFSLPPFSPSRPLRPPF